MNGGSWLGVWIAALGIGAVFSALSQSLRDFSRPALDEILEAIKRPSHTARIKRILDDVDGHAASVSLPRIGCNLIVVVAMVMWITAIRGKEAPSWLEALIAVAASSFLVWTFGSVLPSAVAKHAAEATISRWSRVLRATYILTGPVKMVADFFDEVVRRLSGREEMSESEAVQEEILSVVEEARHEGQVDETEKKMIESVVSFRDLTVGQIMTPRTEIEAMAVTNDLGAVTAFIRAGRHSRIPVYENNLDHILGVFYVKDLMRWLAGGQGPNASNAGGSRAGRTFDLRSLLRPATFVPESKTVRQLLKELLAKRVHIAIVADEYGGTAGLVTIEDIVEEVFGDIQDEYESPEEESAEVKINSAAKVAFVDARAYVDTVNAAIRPLGVSLPESEDYDTVGGFVTVMLGRIPNAGETLRHDGMLLTVLEAEPTRVTRVKLETTHAGDTQPGKDS